jgi:hypothetical protein
MNPSQKQDLNRQLNALVGRIDESIETVEKHAIIMKMNPYEMMYSNGHHMMAPLLLAKAEALNAQVHLNIRKEK